jgi:hypothetical protein
MCRVRKANLNDMISDHGLDVVKIPGTEASKVGSKVNRTAKCLPRKKGFMVQRQPATPPVALSGKLQRVTIDVRLSSIQYGVAGPFSSSAPGMANAYLCSLVNMRIPECCYSIL